MIPNIKMVYNGKLPEDFGLCVTDVKITKPSRKHRPFDIPGKNGAYKEILRSWDNTTVEVSFAILGESSGDVVDKGDALMRWLTEPDSYARLELSTDPDVYRMATVYEDFEIRDKLAKTGEATVVFDCKPQRFLKAGDIALPQIAGAGAPVNIIVAEGYAQDIFSSAFISAVGERIVGNERMTVFNLSSYQGKKLALYYSDARIQRGTAVKGGTMSTDPTTGSGTSVIYGDVFNLYSSKVVLNISANYAAYETPNYFEILNADESLAASIFPTSETIMNPTLYSAKPLVKIGYSSYVSGPVCMINGSPVTLDVSPNADINGQTVSISDVTIDCETMDAYTEIPGYPYPYSQNRYVYVPSDITLKPGENEIKVNNKISYVEIIPKWWTL